MSVDWYAIQSKSNKEDALYTQLIAQNIEVYYPQLRVKPVNPRAHKIKAYFPGYMFVHVDLQAVGMSMLQWTPFSRGMVSFDQEPAAVPEDLIQAIRARVEQVNQQGGEVFDGLQKGDGVSITQGPFAGYEAIFDIRLSGSERVRVLIRLLNERLVPLELRAGQFKQQKKAKS